MKPTKSRDLLCISHLRWDWVYQRPQHLLGRLARDHGYRVFFVEEPHLFADSADYIDAPRVPQRIETLDEPWVISEPAPNVVRCVPGLRADWPFYRSEHADDTQTMRTLLRQLVASHGLAAPIAWLYTPLAVPLLRGSGFTPQAVVYDCMDELALFKGAPPMLRAREAELLQAADCVFAGGRSMYESRRGLHRNLHLFPSSIDAAHFAAATRDATPVPPDARPEGHREGQPVLGFYGVLDERLDRDLLDKVAALRPDWSFVLVGPVAKIDPATLPRRPNIAYPGQRPYEALPGYLKGWDICLMPFALNDATRFISPTKTLEYLAADKPVVSTSVPDVVSGYHEVVRFGDTPEAFVAACEATLAETPGERAERRAQERAILAQTSWDATVARMAALIDAATTLPHRQAAQVRPVSSVTGDAWARRTVGD
jgi:glycosyltransferase involved in cell wall biosynthesis